MKNIIILGAGMVGRAMALDLAKKHNVTSVDRSSKSLALVDNPNIQKIEADLSDTARIRELIQDYDLVISAVPGFMGYKTVQTIIETGKNCVDISFMPEDCMQLDALAKEKGVTVIADMGVAPGMPNLIAGYHHARMQIEEFIYMVGGLPVERKFPFEYKAPFSPVDVVEEYTRPARMKINNVVESREPMSDAELIDFDRIGTLEAFNTDGLRSLLYTLEGVPNMKEKTLRYPGHIKLIQALKASGFLDEKPVKIGDKEISPYEFTTKMLFNQWYLHPDEEEFTVMKVIVRGTENGTKKEYVYDLLDYYDKTERISSMARTTGFTGTSGAELILQEVFTQEGLFPPEIPGKDEKVFSFVMDYLKERGVIYKVRS
ncbi:MAG: saccharopine dehydrogenase [Marinilabiliales bacterium]|nr:MAG: saccharopine dehydrogenase [Marinilabiliales bacterium]